MAKKKKNKVTFQKLKKWSGKKGFGISKGVGETKKEVISGLVDYMADNLDELDEEQLEWYEEQTGKPVKKKKKTKKKKEKAEPKAKKKKKKKEKKDSKPAKAKKKKKRKKKAEVEEEPEFVAITSDPKELRGFAKECEISTKGWKKFEDEDWENLANEIYKAVDNMDDDDKEELTEELFAFHATIKQQEQGELEEEEAEVEEEAEREITLPKKVQLKRWCELAGVEYKKRDATEAATELLEEYEEFDDEDKEEFPEEFIEWADVQLSGEAVEEEEAEEEEEIELPDFKTLKVYAKAVGFKLKDIKPVKDDPKALAQMIVEAYDDEDEEDYPPELVEFNEYMSEVTPEEVEEEEEEVEEEKDTEQLIEWLEEAGYDADDFEEWSHEELVDKLVEDYKDEEAREDLPEESIAFLKEAAPELFKKEKKKGKKKKKKKPKKK